jgi:anti-sigma regulatory factor (Ser/Thr protein kinase)
MIMSREQVLAEAFVELSDTLVADFDVVDFLHTLAGRCVQLLGVAAAGVMVADQRGALRVMASSSEQARLLELFEVESDEGPCVDCFTTGTPAGDSDLDRPDLRWRRFADQARKSGFRSVHAVPVRLRDDVIGVLNLFRTEPGPLDADDARVARALANVATIGLLQHRAVEYRQVLVEQLQHALNSRVIIEQAKGILAEHFDLDMAEAFTELREFARHTGRRLSDVAVDIVNGDHGPDQASIAGPGRFTVLLIRRFDGPALARLRQEVQTRGARHGLDGIPLTKFVLAVHEAAANAVRHGGGRGRLFLWRQADSLWCRVSDHGPGIPAGYQIPRYRPDTDRLGHRGLWLIDQVATSLHLTSDTTGTRLLLRYPLDSAIPPRPDLARPPA